MGYAGKLDLKFKARDLRKNGLSIKEIEKKLGVSRSSVSIWVRDVSLTTEQIDKLYRNKRTGALKGSYVASLNKIKKSEELTKRLKEEGEREVGKISKREFFLTGVAMYFAEGDKSGKNVAFSNSDPRAIKFMTDWFLSVCKASKNKIRCDLYIHDNLNEKEAKKYWSELINIPIEQFRKSYIVKNNKNRLRKVKHIYGVLRVGVSNANLHRKIMGWISGIFSVKSKGSFIPR